MSPNSMDLDSMKYAELQKLAKELGLKAKVKADKLLKMIKQHYKDMEEKEEQVVVQEADRETAPVSAEEGVGSAAVFVNTRRGRGAGTKRKISDTTTETQCGGKATASAAKVDSDPAVSTATRGAAAGAKKRRVSVGEELQESVNERVTEGQQQQQQVDVVEEEPVQADAEAKKAPKAGRIPRLQQQQQKKKQLLKPITPNFKKLHEAQFNKLESIDSYIQRKTKQMDTYRTSVRELKKLSEKTKQQMTGGKTRARVSLFSPAVVNEKPPAAKKGVGEDDAPFRPSVLSTRRINVRFSEATRDNEHKAPLAKTPARRSTCVASSTPDRRSVAKAGKTFAFSATKTPDANGPFVFTGNTSAVATPGTQRKPNFDLKASLSRPLSYKPHKGKLKPFADAKENATTTAAAAANQSLVANTHQGSYKQHRVQTREDRRDKVAADRKQKKQSMLGARRGLAMV